MISNTTYPSSSSCSIGVDLRVDFDACSSNGVDLDTFSGLATVRMDKNNVSPTAPVFRIK